MVREDIFEGLKSGLARGKTLKETMQSFYNSGYKKGEIEEAAKLLLANKTPTQPSPQPLIPQTGSQTIQPSPQTPVAQPQYQPQTITSAKPAQKKTAQMNKLEQTDHLVSYYDTAPQKKKKKVGGLGLVILLVVVLFVLVGALVAVFLFKENIINFFQ